MGGLNRLGVTPKREFAAERREQGLRDLQIVLRLSLFGGDFRGVVDVPPCSG